MLSSSLQKAIPSGLPLEDKTTYCFETVPSEVSPSLLAFSEKISRISHLKDFLLFFSSSIPRKLSAGEMILFYESRHLGLRRAFVRNGQVHEKTTESLWPEFQTINYGNYEARLYLSREMGRPFSKVLLIPFPEINSYFRKISGRPLLFVELLNPEKTQFHLKNFFMERREISGLILKRLLLHTGVSRASLLWSRMFGEWKEPLAILKQFKVTRSNEAFKKLIADCPDLLSQQKTKGLLRLKDHIYQLHYYPVSHPKSKNFSGSGILYCQDLTEYFYLREKLLQSEKMSSLAGLGRNMAHQLNNPLTGISSLIQALRENSKNLSFDEEFQEMEKAARRCQSIIGNLLSFSRSEEDNLEEVLDLNLVLQDIFPLLKTLLEKVCLTLKMDSVPLLVRGNFSLLQQAVFNIILNSCQALQKRNSPKLEIESGFDKNKRVYLSIKDNGPGIPLEQLENIFQPLWTNKKQGEGTGLGLSIAQKVVKSLSGDIYVKSTLEKGACFRIILPSVNQQIQLKS